MYTSGHKFAFSEMPIRRVKEVQFGTLSPKDIQDISVVKINCPQLRDTKTQVPKVGGLLDPRLGTMDPHLKCQTCEESVAECPGHFGHIELAKPVFHIGFLLKTKKILDCICFHCSKLKVDESTPGFLEAIEISDPNARFYKIWNLAKNKKKCGDIYQENVYKEGVTCLKAKCDYEQPLIYKYGVNILVRLKIGPENHEYGRVRRLRASKVLEIFQNISDQDIRTMGISEEYSRPEWMIIQSFLIPPPQIRPSIHYSSSRHCEDDLTYILSNIWKVNAAIRYYESIEAPSHIIREFEDLLQFHIISYMNNEITYQPWVKHISGRPLKSIRARLTGKSGHIRNNLMGKRVDFSARSVITGDPYLALDQVGVPLSIARQLTYPEIVAPFNIKRLEKLVGNGPLNHPGARYIIRKEGERVDLHYADALSLQYGDKVERHIVNDDVVIFNRQPSLHKMSMMGHRVKIMPCSTFRLNLSATPPYNADFDGDEMNIHVPQSVETRAEISEICMVPKQIVSPQSNRPVMGLVQDTLCGIRKLSLRDNFICRDMLMNIIMYIPSWDGVMPTPAIIKPKPMWTGKQVLSMVIPQGINCCSFYVSHPDDENTFMSPGDSRVIIEDGQLLCGIICKKTAGTTSSGLVHIIMNDLGPDAANTFLTDTQQVVNHWLLENGFSVGIGDTIADKYTKESIADILLQAKQRVQQLISQAQQDTLEIQLGMTMYESFEAHVNQALNKARDVAGKMTEKKFKDDNNVKQMLMAGSKGSFINISQMSACVGQQNIAGKSIPFGFELRTLPHFSKNDNNPYSRGFVENSYLTGLTPAEFFFHAMSGREGLIDTAIKTSETGYIQRRLIKGMEDVMVKYDGTVRNSLGHIVEFCYGEDGMDATYLENQKLVSLKYNQEEFEKYYKVYIPDEGFKSGTLDYSVLNNIESNNDVQVCLDQEFNQLSKDRQFLRIMVENGEDKWPLPVNLRRLITCAHHKFDIDPRKPSDLHPLNIIDSIKQLSDRLFVVQGSDQISQETQRNSTLLFQILLRSTFSVKRVIEEFHLSSTAFEWILGEIESRFMNSVVTPGEMVGAIAAQSIGEPATQMTLNTFHFAGVSSKNVTLGVPRLKEIVNVSRRLKTPITEVWLDGKISLDINLAKQMQSNLEHTALQDVASVSEIHYDPNPRNTVIKEDVDLVEIYYQLEDDDSPFINSAAPWLIRFELDRGSMINRHITVAKVVQEITKTYGNDLHVMGSDENSEKLVIRCRILLPDGEDFNADSVEVYYFLRLLVENMLKSVTICGVRGIQKVYIIERKNTAIDKDGSFQNTTEWGLETQGCNLFQVIRQIGVDHTRTFSNKTSEILEVLGIEATRNVLLKQLRDVIAFDGSYVNYRHLALLCDVMTSLGYLMSMTRFGFNRRQTGALMRSTFEETFRIFSDAAVLGEFDDCAGISEKIILGQLVEAGTGGFDILLDDDMLQPTKQDEDKMCSSGERNHHVTSDLACVYSDTLGSNDTYSSDWLSFTPSSSPPTPSFSPSYMYDDITRISTPWCNTLGSYSPSRKDYSFDDPKCTSFRSNSRISYDPLSPTREMYDPLSPTREMYDPTSPTSDSYDSTSPTSDSYDPTSPSTDIYDPNKSPMLYTYSSADSRYSPMNSTSSQIKQAYSTTTPNYYSMTPIYDPRNREYSPRAPSCSLTAPTYSPVTLYPAAPGYSPAVPGYSARYSPRALSYSPTAPSYSSTVPSYSATGNIDDKQRRNYHSTTH